MKLTNYVGGQWIAGAGTGQALVDPVLGTEIARASSEEIDFGAALDHARTKGNPALRALTFAERAALLSRIVDVLTANRSAYSEISLANSGATEADTAFDVDGAIFTLKFYARAAAALGNARYLIDGGVTPLSKDKSFQSLHPMFPVRGVAVLINAFNFPAWGLWEKAAPALLSGVPVFVKPATATAWLTHRMVEDVIKAGVLPDGALSIICGSAGDLLNHVTADDVISFTGSTDTAARIRTGEAVVRASVRINVEADSLNATLMGPDVQTGAPEFDLLVNEVVREMTLKAGQKCTAIRRVLVPASQKDALAEALASRLSGVAVGNPRNKDVRMGPLVNKAQQRAAQEGIAQLKREATVLYDGGTSFRPLDADPAVSAFVPPTLLLCKDPMHAQAVHDVEVFGPVATLLSYEDLNQALTLAHRGQGSLVVSVFSGDNKVIETAAFELARTHGRVLAVNAGVGRAHTGHGNVVPMSLHGGPGRAGGGEELGGLRALMFYHRRVAIQGSEDLVKALAADGVELHY